MTRITLDILLQQLLCHLQVNHISLACKYHHSSHSLQALRSKSRCLYRQRINKGACLAGEPDAMARDGKAGQLNNGSGVRLYSPFSNICSTSNRATSRLAWLCLCAHYADTRKFRQEVSDWNLSALSSAASREGGQDDGVECADNSIEENGKSHVEGRNTPSRLKLLRH